MMRVVRYGPKHKTAWDTAIRVSRNGTFLFYRDYLEYHGPRFEDHSLMIIDGPDLVAVLPGHQTGTAYISHGGITHGGFVIDDTVKLPVVLGLFDAVGAYLIDAGFTSWAYKTVPSIYHRVPAEEDRCALFLLDAQLVRRAMLSVLTAGSRPALQQRRERRIARASRSRVQIRETHDFEQYWRILAERLQEAFGTRPVHTLEEITLLQSRFPANIRLFAAFEDQAMTAGIVIYESDRVARTQYIAADSRGRASGALDLLVSTLIHETFADKPFLDFGTSDECDGRWLNQGLVEYKEGFGGRSVAHDHYRIDLGRPVRCQLSLSTGRPLT